MNQQFKAWKYKSSNVSLEESHASVATHQNSGFLRRLLAFIGPGYMVAVGYMDPGNWATSLAGGSKFGYTLLSVVLISNIMAILLQALCVRLGIATGRDLAQACRDAYPKPVSLLLWIMAEAAIIATDLAEVIGTAIGINLLFGVPLEWAVIITAADVFIILYLQKLGFRYLEAFVIALMLVIMGCFAFQIMLSQPEIAPMLKGFIPTTQLVSNPEMLYLAMGILGATVMPHNLYLHSSIVQTRAIGPSVENKRSAIKFATIDSTIALMLALSVNASILVLAASTFHKSGNTQVAEIQEAYQLLSPMLGSAWAATLFAVALLCCGLNSTVTATLAGQIVMEGFISIKLTPWLRRLITRTLAIIPAVAVTLLYGESGTAQLLILSQVVLSLQLPCAIIPLVMFTSNRAKMGAFVSPKWLTIITALIAVIIVVLNIKLIVDFITS